MCAHPRPPSYSIRDERVRRKVRDILVEIGGDADSVLRDLMTLLSLPGSDLLDGAQDSATVQGSMLVEPDVGQIARFERVVSEQVLHRAKQEED